MDVKGGLRADGSVAGYDFATRYPSNGAPTLALLLTGRMAPTPAVFEMGDRTAIPPYDYDHLRVVAHDMPPIARASWLRGVSALPNTFAHESYIDELATEAGVDPIEYRLRYLRDPRAVDLVHAVAERAGWTPRPVWKPPVAENDIVRGRGFAYALYVHSKFPGYGAAWSAWIADVAVNKATGDVSVTRVVAGQDSGLMINPDGVRHQIHGNVIQSTSRALMEQVSFDRSTVTSREWGAYPIIKFPDIPEIDVLMLPRQDQPPLGVGESASVPSAAAIANAIFDATGVRFREPPFTRERILAGLQGEARATPATLPLASTPPSPTASGRWQDPFVRRRGALATVAAVCTAVVGIAAAVLPWRSIAPIARPDASVYSAATIARGQQLAALGDCAVCHTNTNGGILNAGGRALATPFGTIYSTNITPDPETGIGAWSYPAFERAMREGIHRDGTASLSGLSLSAFCQDDRRRPAGTLRVSDGAAAGACRQSPHQPCLSVQLASAAGGMERAVPSSRRVRTQCGAIGHMESRRLSGRGPWPLRRLPFAAKRARRGTGRGVSGRRFRRGLGSTAADVAVSRADSLERGRSVRLFAHRRIPLPRRRGGTDGAGGERTCGAARRRHSRHGGLSRLVPGERHRQAGAGRAGGQTRNARPVARVASASSMGARLYDGACAVCHAVGGAALFGSRPSLALNSNLHGAMPDNLVQVILHGIASPASSELGYMPAFKDSLTDDQLAELVSYLRQQFAPDKPPWADVRAAVSRVRQTDPSG